MAHRTLAGAAWDRLRCPRATTGFTRDVTRATLASRLKVPIQKLPRSATGSDLRRLRLHWWRCSNVPSGITRIRGGGSDCWPSVRRADAGPSVGGFDRMTSAAPLVHTHPIGHTVPMGAAGGNEWCNSPLSRRAPVCLPRRCWLVFSLCLPTASAIDV